MIGGRNAMLLHSNGVILFRASLLRGTSNLRLCRLNMHSLLPIAWYRFSLRSHFLSLTQKVTKKVKSLERLLCRTGPSPCKSGKTWAGNICGHSMRIGPCTAKISYALPLRAMPPSFCLISSEAFLMTEKGKILFKRSTLNESCSKAGKGSTKSAGLGVLPVGGRIFLS
jgi:hypothetical protein